MKITVCQGCGEEFETSFNVKRNYCDDCSLVRNNDYSNLDEIEFDDLDDE